MPRVRLTRGRGYIPLPQSIAIWRNLGGRGRLFALSLWRCLSLWGCLALWRGFSFLRRGLFCRCFLSCGLFGGNLLGWDCFLGHFLGLLAPHHHERKQEDDYEDDDYDQYPEPPGVLRWRGNRRFSRYRHRVGGHRPCRAFAACDPVTV